MRQNKEIERFRVSENSRNALAEIALTERIRHQLSASVFVVLMKRDTFCMLRRKGTGWMDGSFSLPAGGLEAEETIAAAAIREVREEVGVLIDRKDLQLAHTLHSRTEGRTWVGHFFRASIWEGTPAICEPDKHGDLHWKTISTLPENTIPYVRQALLCIHSHQPYSEYGWE